MIFQTVIKNHPTNKSPGPDGFTGKSYPISREELTSFSNSPKTFQRKEYSQVHSLRPLPPKYQNQTKISQKKGKLQANITDEHEHKNPQQNTSKQNPIAL